MPNPSVFKRFVEVGRVILIQSGPYEGKIAAIVEIIDHNRAVIDGPATGVPRQSIAYRHIVLTPIVIKKLPRGARSGVVKKYFEKEEISQKWQVCTYVSSSTVRLMAFTPRSASSWAKSLEIKKARQSLTDFDRFNIQIMKKNRRDRVRRELAKAKKTTA